MRIRDLHFTNQIFNVNLTIFWLIVTICQPVWDLSFFKDECRLETDILMLMIFHCTNLQPKHLIWARKNLMMHTEFHGKKIEKEIQKIGLSWANLRSRFASYASWANRHRINFAFVGSLQSITLYIFSFIIQGTGCSFQYLLIFVL